jgi:hypothetical protein
MLANRMLCALVLLVAGGGCGSSMGGDDAPADAGDPIIMYQPFTSATWSLATAGGRAQLSVSDGTGATACGLATDQHHSPGAAGVQLILHLPDMVTDPCPSGNYTMKKNCAASLGTEAYVPAGCAFYRKWDAQGKLVGIAASLDGGITVVGNTNSCTLRVLISFLGTNYGETLTLTNGVGAQPWCGS